MAALKDNISRLDPTASTDSSVRPGYVCLAQVQYEEALTHFNCVLQIQQQYFLSDHPSFKISLCHF
jgi:hypothetical protein